jgi:two-component system chemotaxis sensor kinase CheA
MAQDPYKYFRPEARDLVDQFAKGIFEIEKGKGNAGAVQNLLRLAHTLKGAARVVRQPEIANLAHAIEDTLSPVRDAAETVTRQHIDTVLEYLDGISSRLIALTPEIEAALPAARKSDAENDLRTVRIDTAEVDTVLDGVAEAHLLLNGLRKSVDGVERARRLSDQLSIQGAPVRTSDRGRPSRGVADPRATIVEELRRQFGDTGRELRSTIDQLDRELRQLREAAERLRLLAVENLFMVLERTARDTAHAQAKNVIFKGTGGEIRLDAHVIGSIQSALVQIVRNAVAHGIEPESERTAAGKPPAGCVSVEVSRRGREIVFECRDDGRGIDLKAIQRAAQKRGMPGSTDARTSAPDLMRMLLQGGISTSKTITEVSGRGIGLDIVREVVERLGGRISFDTKLGGGTTFELIIPPSLASMDALIVETGVAGNAVGIPLSAVRGTLRVAAADISHGPATATVLHQMTAVPFMPLSTALTGAKWPTDRNWTAIVVTGAAGTVAFGVNRLLGVGLTVVRPLPAGMAASAAVAGAALDAEGNPRLVIDPDGLVTVACRGGASKPESVSPKRPVLVVDDSMTTRMLEKSILESAGFDVGVALSGEEAFERLQDKRFALILVDVEMPGMDGFTFIERLRAAPALSGIPAILVTSRATPEDIERGRGVGANGYIVKSEFNQAELLQTIERLIG